MAPPPKKKRNSRRSTLSTAVEILNSRRSEVMMGFFSQKVTADLGSILSGDVKAKFRFNINKE